MNSPSKNKSCEVASRSSDVIASVEKVWTVRRRRKSLPPSETVERGSLVGSDSARIDLMMVLGMLNAYRSYQWYTLLEPTRTSSGGECECMKPKARGEESLTIRKAVVHVFPG